MKIAKACTSYTGAVAGAVLSLAMLAGAPAVHAGSADTSMCQDLERAERGLCRAAIKSGCGQDGRNQESIHCAKLESNYRKVSGGNTPVWLLSVNNDPVVEELIP